MLIAGSGSQPQRTACGLRLRTTVPCLSIPPPAPSSANSDGSAMAFTHEGIKAGGATPSATVKVWDPACHWTLLTLFVIAFVTGDESERVHIAAVTASRYCWRCDFLGRCRSAQCTVFRLCAIATRRAGLLAGCREPQDAAISRPQPCWRCDDCRANGSTDRHGCHRLHNDNRCLLGSQMGRGGSRGARLSHASWRWPVCTFWASRPQACCIVRIWSKRCGRDASGQCKRTLEAAQRNRRLQLRRCRVSLRRVFQATTADVLPMRRL